MTTRQLSSYGSDQLRILPAHRVPIGNSRRAPTAIRMKPTICTTETGLVLGVVLSRARMLVNPMATPRQSVITA